MRVLLIGDHPDGLALVLALTAQGKHVCTAYAGPAALLDALKVKGLLPAWVKDAEAALALKDIDAVVVADDLMHRPQLLKRALQSDKHVFCVYPPDLDPNIAYEALAIQLDTHKQLLPLMLGRLSPALQFIQQTTRQQRWGSLQHLELEVGFPLTADLLAEKPNVPMPAAKMRQVLKELDRVWERHPLLHLWDVLRCCGVEVQELTALMGHGTELSPRERINITGRFQNEAFFQLLLQPLPAEHMPTLRCLWRGNRGEWEWKAPHGLEGASTWESRCKDQPAEAAELPGCERTSLWNQYVSALEENQPLPTWTDATRCLELFDAVRRSVRRRRTIVLDYEAASELSNFKSTMTALGCGVLILCMVLFFATPTFPWLKYLIFPILLLYMSLQIFRYFARETPPGWEAAEPVDALPTVRQGSLDGPAPTQQTESQPSQPAHEQHHNQA